MKLINVFSSRLKKAAAAGALVVAGMFMATSLVSAQSFPTYTTPVFNSFATGAPYGDERDFLRIAPNGSNAYANDFNQCADGALANLAVYIHNDAAAGYNGTNFDGTAVAKDVNLSVTSAFGTTASNFAINGKISGSNFSAATDGVTVTCGDGQYKLDYVSGSAKLYAGSQNGVVLPDAVFTPAGTTIGHDALNGVWPGCWEFVGAVKLQVKLTKVVPEVPVYECKLVNITKIGDRKVKVSVSTVTNPSDRVSVKSVEFNYGDGSAATSSDEHTYTGNGPFTITAKVTYTVDGEDVTPEVQALCVGQVSFETPKPPVPPTIPDTGAGNIVAMLATVAVVGAVAHRVYTVRRSR